MAQQNGNQEPHILFELAGATYAVPSRDVQRLEMLGPVTPVPNAPPFVEGVVSVRGEVIPVVSLRARFGFPALPPGPRGRLLVVRVGRRSVGLVVDSAREFASIAEGAIEPAPASMAGLSGEYLRGIAQLGERLVLVLTVAGLLDVNTVERAIQQPTAETA